jgi:hypothetical protein
MQNMENKIESKKCPNPKCGKKIVPEIDVRTKTDAKHETIEKLTGSPFFQHIDVWYKCECGYQCHQTYTNGKLASESISNAPRR